MRGGGRGAEGGFPSCLPLTVLTERGSFPFNPPGISWHDHVTQRMSPVGLQRARECILVPKVTTRRDHPQLLSFAKRRACGKTRRRKNAHHKAYQRHIQCRAPQPILQIRAKLLMNHDLENVARTRLTLTIGRAQGFLHRDIQKRRRKDFLEPRMRNVTPARSDFAFIRALYFVMLGSISSHRKIQIS